MTRRMIAALIALTLTTSVAGCGTNAASHVTLWLDYTPWSAHIPIDVAESRGYFRDQGLSVDVRAPLNTTDPLKLAAAGGNTVSLGYMSDVVTSEARGIPVESIGALVQHHLNCIMTLRSSGITSPRQLAGKKIGASETPADGVILNTVFKHAGVTGTVRNVNVNYDYVPSLLSHRVDAIEGAYQVWEKIQIEQRGQHVNVIQLQKWGVPDEYELVFLSGRSLVRNRPDLLSRFMKAVEEGARFAVAHPARAVNIFIKANSSYDNSKGRALVSRSWHDLIPFVQPGGVRFGHQSPSRWRRLAVWMHANNLVSKMVPNSRLFTNRFLH